MALYAYSFLNNRRLSLQSRVFPSAVLTIPLSRFKRTPGCASFVRMKLKIGKVYNVRILDPVEMGRCVLRGVGFDQIPESKFKNQLRNSPAQIEHSFLVFEKIKGKNKCIFVVDPYHCKLTLIKKRKR
ncbi:MAG: hypothetical protein LiPW41_697 [Parcubacteria group bacterium LiPW_41]|nr:MAG: hypothetical protein LiPW41_697 [Parcubacteria group bacterium LiPW_41]